MKAIPAKGQPLRPTQVAPPRWSGYWKWMTWLILAEAALFSLLVYIVSSK